MKAYLRGLIVLALVFGNASLLSGAALKLDDTLKVAVYHSPPFGIYNEDGTYGGLMVELWRNVAQELDLKYNFDLADMEGTLEGLNSGVYDVGLGAISITPKRERLVDFTQPVNPSGTGVAVAAGRFSDSIWTYLPPILSSLTKLILSLAVVLVISGTLVWYFEKRKNTEMFHSKFGGLGDGLWWAAVTMATVGYGDKVPKTAVGRSIAIIWMFTSIVLVSIFTANASSIFTTIKQETKVGDVNAIRRMKVGAVQKSSGEEFLMREHIEFTAYADIESALIDLDRGEIGAVVSNIPILKYHANHRYHEKISVSNQALLKNNMGIALRPNSQLTEPMNQSLLRIITEDKGQLLLYSYIGAN